MYRLPLFFVVLVTVGCGGEGPAAPVEVHHGLEAEQVAPHCGDGLVAADELCDPGQPAPLCSALSTHFRRGQATCRADCSGFDLSTCERRRVPTDRHGEKGEVVKPGVADPRWSDAVCNDGQPFSMMVRLAPPGSPQADRWVIALEGGGFCDDDASPCSARSDYHTSPWSRPNGDFRSFTPSGFLSRKSAVNPPFAQANHAYLHYCSSDVWTGDDTAGVSTSFDSRSSDGVTHFTGKRNARAGIEVLMQRFGLRDAPDTEVLFMGTSAGALGVFANAHLVAERLPNVAVGGRLRVLHDGGWIPQWSHGWIGSGASSFDQGLAAAHGLWGARLDPVCEADHVGQEQRCFFGAEIYPYLAHGMQLPVFVQNSQMDSVFARVGEARCNASAANWRATMQAEMAQLPAVFSLWDSYHTLSNSTCKLGFGPQNTANGRDGRYGPTVWRWWDGAVAPVIVTGSLPLGCGVTDPCQ